jgi:hypothetical protein
MRLSRTLTLSVLGIPLVLLLGAGAARASVNFDVAVGMDVNEDTRIFLNVSNQVWHPAAPMTVIQGCRYPEDDFPVVSFLAYQSHRDPAFILRLRSDGYPWYEIFYRLHVDPGVLFVGIDHDPGPPYGKAWGYWNHGRHDPRERIHFSDRDVVGLVKVQTAARHFGASPYSVMEGQRHGGRVEVYTAGRWREKHGRQGWAEGPGHGKGHGGGEDQGDSGQGHGHGHGNGGGKGHGHGGDNDH